MEFYAHEIDRDVLILRADGGLNSQTAQQFVEELAALVDAGIRKIIVDCTLLDYLSSYGISVLLRVHARMRKRGGDVKLCGVKGVVNDVLKITNLDHVLHVYADVDRARLAFRDAASHEGTQGRSH